tara:strand:+ start:177 stop:407 length:231 start_codon:yes stop_codon:yes gene_type:complete
MKNRIKKVMASVFLEEENKISDDISQINFEKWESLQHLMLIVELESEFGVSFEPEDMVKMTSLEMIEKQLILTMER